ncbi:U2 small nuclear ribonucleoprotein A'-like isoform X3 [Triticum dicoccoides]|uniref:U2 small nuclear ribonucleoprotein A'-like isoform X3 n=1 Tax=Triticum dicoccoides TaxID=85692 RepID=UPI00189123DB|nr:U2 small nuclear ribonucleoprotein A'-like isoform X3 [Triticum dicoccoides]
MVRLSADLIWHFFNAVKERELDLRGNKIAFIENIGATEDKFDMIDLSDDEIVKLENFPFMNRLGTLLINNNRITRINPNLGEFLHKMHTLVLTNNRLTSLAEIDPLASLPKLQFLSLLDNTVTKQLDYRLYVIHKLKHLRLLDFKIVKQQEKCEAAQKFHSKETEEGAKRAATKAYTLGQVVDSHGTTKDQGAKVVAPTPAQITAIKFEAPYAMYWHTLVCHRDQALSTGQVPAQFALPKPDTNMAQASEEAEAEKMETDGQDQEDGADEQKQTDESALIQEAAIVNSQPLDELTRLEKEFLGADLDCIYDTLSNIGSYIYKNFERAPFNFIVSWRKRFFRGLHILPPPRRQEPGRPP